MRARIGGDRCYDPRRVMVGRGLPVWLAAGLVALAPARARGEPAHASAEVEGERCAAVWAIGGLATAEQRGLHELCARRLAPTRSHAPLLAALAGRGTWESAAVGTIAGGAAPHVDVGAEAGHEGRAQRLAGLRAGLRAGLVQRHAPAAGRGDGRCGWVRAAFDRYVEDLEAGEVPLPPIADYALAGDRCLGLPADAVAEVHFLTIAAAPGASLTVVAGAGERAVVQWLAPDEAIAREGRSLFVVAVPRWSSVTVEARRGEAEPPARWHGFVTRDQTVWDRSPESGCLRVSIGLEDDTTLLLDGRPLTRGKPLARRTVGIVGGSHELVGLRCRGADAGRTCEVNFRERLAESARTTTENLCRDISIDLTRRNSVTMLAAQAAPGCDGALAFQVGAQATEYLTATQRDSGREFRDMTAMASMTEALAELKASLNPAAGQAIGAATGADTLDQLGTVAKEAWRQGIDSLLAFELRCSTSRTGYTVVGSRLAVREVLARDRSDVTGIDLQQVRTVESLPVRQAGQLPAAVASVIDRLFAVDHLRFLGEGGDLDHRRRAELELAMFHRGLKGEDAAAWTPVVEAIHVADDRSERPRACAQLAATERAATVAEAVKKIVAGARTRRRRVKVALRRVDGGADEANTRSATFAAGIEAGPPGTYLVTARWQDGEVQDATCVRFEAEQREVWIGATIAPDTTTLAGVRPYQWMHVRAHAGYMYYRPFRWLGFGQVFVYSYSKYLSRQGQPSWQDVTVEPGGSAEPFQWHRHAVMTGPTVEVRTRDATWPVELRARAAVVAGLGIVDTSKVNQAFVDFVTPDRYASGNGRRFTPNLDFTLDLGFTYQRGPVVLGQSLLLGAIAINEMASARHAATALNGGGLVLGIGLAIGGAW